MIVGDLLRLEDLPLGLAWGTADLLDRPVTGVTSTDLQDPARYLQPGELVLSGLVWWKPESGAEQQPDAALRFATALSSARVAALLAGEGTHGEVPPSLVDACRLHGIPLISIPAGTSFRSVTDRIYLRLWGELSTGSTPAGALPEAVRQELAELLEAGAPLARVLSLASTRLGLPPCAILTPTGRPIAPTPTPHPTCAPAPAAAALGSAPGSAAAAVPGSAAVAADTATVGAVPATSTGAATATPAARATGVGTATTTPAARARGVGSATATGAARAAGVGTATALAFAADPAPACAVDAAAATAAAATAAPATATLAAAAAAPGAAHLATAATTAANFTPAPAPALAAAALAATAALAAAAADGSVPIGPPEASPFAGWRLTGTSAASRALAELLAPRRLSARSQDSACRRAAADLFDLLAASGTADREDFAHALGACSLPVGGPLTTLSARIDRAPAVWAVEALTELLHLAAVRFVAGSDERGEAAAVVAGTVTDLRPLLPGLQALLGPGQQLRIGVGPTAEATVAALRGSLVGARYALASAAPYADAARLDSLASLLAGIPPQVTAAFHERLLGRLVSNDRENGVSLVDTLSAFLEHDGSWSRTAKALHVHVNTVHYRVRRIEELTGRSLVRLADQTDLRAALLCAPAPAPAPA